MQIIAIKIIYSLLLFELAFSNLSLLRYFKLKTLQVFRSSLSKKFFLFILYVFEERTLYSSIFCFIYSYISMKLNVMKILTRSK